MMRLKSFVKLALVGMLCMILFGGCGAGGGGGTTPTPTPTPASVTTVSGSVVDGFVVGATVQAYLINANGTKGAPVGSATTTDASGNYTLSLGTLTTGPLLIETSGGSYVDWATGTAVNLTAADRMSAVISSAVSPATVSAMITPLTSMAAQRALQDIALNGTAVATAIDTANADVGAYFGGFNILTDKPINPTVAGSATGVSQNCVNYGLVLAGISKNASTKGLQPFSLVSAMIKDAEDGAFDGKQGATQLTVTNASGVGTTNLTAADSKGALGTGINAFQASLSNQSGGTVTASIPTNLASPTNPGTVFDKPNPPTNFTAIGSSSSQVDLAWTASNGATSYKVYEGTTLKKTVTTTAASDTGLTASTSYCYKVTALDAAGNESNPTGQLCVPTLPAPQPASIELLVSSPQLNSDGASTVALTAVVKDSANRVLSGQKVDFTADSGTLVVTSDTTDNTGSAKATLGTGGNPANRTINLTAATGSLTSANAVSVAGTTLAISGLSSLSLGSQTDLTIFLSNSAGTGVADKTVTVTSDKGNAITLLTPKTNASGQLVARVNATVSGDDVITASAIGAIKTFALTVSPSVLTITAPALNTEVPIATNRAFSVLLTNGGVPVAGATINFLTSRGAVSSATALTAANGTASVNVSSTTPGKADLTAFVTNGASAKTSIEFVATTPAKMKLTPDPVSIGTNASGATTEKSLITATVRDANDNLVKNQVVNFSLTSDVSGGYLSPATATTDSSGTASVYYIAGASSTGVDGVKISAAVTGYPGVIANTTLTVGNKAVFIKLGSAPKINSPSDLLYRQDYLALVTSSTGTAIPGVTVTATLIPQYYMKGYYIVSGTKWQQVPTLVASSSTRPDVPACANEDGITHNPLYDYNGLLDTGEDQNNNAKLDPGNIASVTATVTDSNGFSTVSITYARDYAYWANVRLVVRATVEGDNNTDAVEFDLPGAAADFKDVAVAPPGFVSPFGVSTSCFDTKPTAPTGLTASASSSTQVNLAWTASTGASGYKIYRDGTAVNTVTAVTATDAGLTPGTLYCYQVSAFDSTGSESDKSAQVCVTTPTLAPPTNPTVTAFSSSQINISWTASANAVGHRIYRDGVATVWRTVTMPTLSTADTGLVSGSSHCYQIAAYDATGVESAKTGQMCATTPELAAPTNLTVTASSSTQIDLAWTTVTGAAGYRIYRAGAVLKTVGQPPLPLPLNTTTSDTGLSANSFYCYTVSVLDGAGNESSQSSQLCATTYGPPPAVPTALVASATLPNQVDLSWTGSTGASQYKVYRNGVLMTATTATTYSDTTALANTQYTYTVSAIDATGSESGATAPYLAHTGLTVPSNVTVTVNSSSQITLSWTNSGGALVTGYKVYKAGSLLGAVTATSIVDGGLAANTQYCYSVSSTGNAGGESARSVTVCGTTQPPPVPATVNLLVSSPQLNSDGATTVTLTAVVKDTANRALSGQTVTFAADSGLLTVVSAVTSASGTATATLGTGGDPENRTINVTASTAGINAVNTVTVTGTTLSISGSASLSFGDTIPLTIFLKDSAGTGIAGKTLTVTSAKGNTLSPGRTTDANGQLIVNVTATVGGADTITASAIGATKTFALTVNASILTFTAPTTGAEMAIGALQPIAAKYTISGVEQPGVTVNFVTTRGTLSSATAVTNASGVATVNASATNSGPVLFLASVAGGPSAQVAAEYVATTVNTVTLQAAPNTIGTNSGGLTNEKSLITAVVRDANNNLVKGKTVSFNIVNDASGGSLTPASSITDSSGTASTYFIAGGSTSALNGVTIRGSVDGTAVSSTTTLTVAQKALFVTLATGPYITETADKVRYQKDYVALVTDAAGDPVANATVVATVTPVYYQKGYYIYPTAAIRWQQVVTLQPASTTLPGIPACANEDGITHNPLYDYNGVLDPGEDQNGNTQLDPGNVVSVTATATDATGHSTIRLVYAKDFAYWVNVKLEAFASTAGSTASASAIFDLPGMAGDYTSSSVAPPGQPSPFGMTTSCFVDLSVTTISSTQMWVSWQRSSTAASYNVYRNSVFLSNVTTNSLKDTGLTGGTQYCYQIKTVSSLGIESAFTETVCGTTDPTLPPTPTGLTAAGEEILPPTSPKTYRVKLSWDNMGAAVYRIYRDGGAAPLLSSTGTAANDTAVDAGTGYCYQISAVDGTGNESAKSTSVCTATPTP
jgi:fibronectin type 3 domain-containing protein